VTHPPIVAQTPLYVSMLLVLAATIVGSFGAVFLKMGAARINSNVLSFANSRLLVGVTLYLGSSVFYGLSIKGAQLSVVYPMVSLANVWALIWSKWFFKEHLTQAKLVGLALILLGVCLVGLGN
jgi:multidrug transporter EmrE-like cation transporter